MTFPSSRHITSIQPNEILYMSMRAGYHLEPVQGTKNQMEVVNKPRHTRGYSKSVFLARIEANNPQTATLTIQFTDSGSNYIATVRYGDIAVAQLYLANSAPLQDAAIPGRPGDNALGSVSFGVWQKSSEILIPIYF